MASKSNKQWTAYLILLFLESYLEGAETAFSQGEIDQHLYIGRTSLAKGQLADALTHYNVAIESDPTNYLIYFERGTIYLALEKPNNALNDFTMVLKMKHNFTNARVQRGNVYIKICDYVNAEKDLSEVFEEDPSNEDANFLYRQICSARQQSKQIKELSRNGEYETLIAVLTQLLEISPMCENFRELRADCYVKTKDILSAITDLSEIYRVFTDSVQSPVY